METPTAVRMTRSQARAMAESGGTPLAIPVAESTRTRSTRTASKLKQEATDAEDDLYDATVPMSALEEPMMLAKETLMQAPIAETSFFSPRKALGDVTNSGLEAVQLIVVKTPAKTPPATLAVAKTPLAKTPIAMATAKCLQIFEDEAVVASAEDAAPEKEASEPVQEKEEASEPVQEEEEASEPIQMKTPAAKTPAAKTPAAKTPSTNARRSTRLASAIKGNKTPEPAAVEAEVLAAASPVEEQEEEEAVVLAPASPAQEAEAPLSLITESLEFEVEEVSVEVPSQRDLFQELEELEAVEVEKDVDEAAVAFPSSPVRLAEEAFLASMVSGAIGRSLEMPASPLAEVAAADLSSANLSSKSPAPLVWEADEETFSESDSDLCLAEGPEAEAQDAAAAVEAAGEKSPSLRQLRAQIKDLSMASRGRWMDNGVDLAGEDVAGDDALVAPRQVASSVSQVQEENADEALAGMQERLKADHQAQRAQQKGQDRHLKRMKARTNRTARAERQIEAGEAEGAQEEAVAWANSRVDVRGQPAFGGAHMRFNATTGQPCTSPGNVPTPYVTPACSPDRFGYEFVGDDGLEAFQAEGLFDDDNQSQEDEDDSSDCSTGAVVNSNTLPRRTPLKGMKGSEGMHMRYNEETEAAQESPTNGAVRLRGVTVATGGHMRFDKK